MCRVIILSRKEHVNDDDAGGGGATITNASDSVVLVVVMDHSSATATMNSPLGFAILDCIYIGCVMCMYGDRMFVMRIVGMLLNVGGFGGSCYDDVAIASHRTTYGRTAKPTRFEIHGRRPRHSRRWLPNFPNVDHLTLLPNKIGKMLNVGEGLNQRKKGHEASQCDTNIYINIVYTVNADQDGES